MEDQDSDQLEQIASRLPEVLSLSSSFNELGLTKPPVVSGPPPFFLFKGRLGSSSQLNEQMPGSKQGDCLEQRQSIDGFSDNLPAHSGMKNMQSPSLEFGLPPSTFEQNCFLDLQSSFFVPYQQLNRTNRSFCDTKDSFDFNNPYLYLQQLHDQGLEEQKLRITQDSALRPFPATETQPYIEIPTWHQLDQVNKVCNSNGSAFHMAQSQLEASLVDNFLGRKQYHDKHDYSFFPQEQEFVTSRFTSSPPKEFLQHHNLGKVGRRIFPEKMLTRTQGVNSIRTLVYNQQAGRLNANNRDTGSHFLGPNKSFKIEGWNSCSSSPDTFTKKLAPKFLTTTYSFVDDIAGIVCLMAKDQEGCHLLQNVLKEGKREDIHKIFFEISHHIVELMMDPFGNYVVQKLLDVCNENQREIIVCLITQTAGELIVVSCNEYGTRAVQKLIETIRTPEQYFKIVSSLKPGIVSLMKHSEGNHVASSCLKLLSPEYREFLFDAAVGHSVELAKDCQGCVVLQKCISELNGKLKDMFLSQIIPKAHDLSQDTYGNFVVQKIFEQKIQWATAETLDRLNGYYQALSMHRHGSHVVETCLKYARNERLVGIVRELTTEPQFIQIMIDRFGNYVIQTAYKECKGTLRAALVAAIRPHVKVLRISPFGRRVLSKTCLEK